MKDVRSDFPILAKHPKIIYLDSACTSLKPNQVIEAETSYYTEYGACGGRSSHTLGRRTNEKLDEARSKVAAFHSPPVRPATWPPSM